ncbi:MAG: insulinase family protein [Elusimicrobia bacterium]|nr:insulinase family protein [Elusimicrobiota bacterium]
MKNLISKASVLGAIMAMSLSTARAVPLNLPKAPPLKFDPPKGERVVLPNGMIVYLLNDPALPAVRINAVVRTGTINDPADKVGLGALTAGMLEDGGSAAYKAEEIDKTLEYLGATINSSIEVEDASVSMFALKKDFDKVLDIYADVLMHPAFEAEKFNIFKKAELEMIRRRNDDPGKSVVREALRQYYGKNHPYGRRNEAEVIEGITIADLQAQHSAYYRPNNVIMAVSGSYGTKEEILAKLEQRFGKWEKREIKAPVMAPPATHAGRSVFFIDKEVPQAFIMIVQKGIQRPDPVFFPLGITNDVVGAPGLSSRLWDTVRARKGLAYTVYSASVRHTEYPGHLFAYCGTKPETYSQALSEILKQLKIAKTEPLSQQELDDAKGAKINSFVFMFKTPFDVVSQRALLEHLGFGPDYLETYVSNVSGVTRDSAFAAASKIFDPDNALIFVIGNSKKFDKPLSEFGPVTELKED